MSNKEDSSGNTWATGSYLPDFVAGLYYRYGLLVATNPCKFITVAILSFILMSTPLWYLPFPGYLPQDYVTPIQNYSVPSPAPEGGLQLSPSPTPTPLWYQGPPRAYIQQVVVRSIVSPWRHNISISDSIRGPLSSVFRLSQIIGDFQMKYNKSVNLGTECLLVQDVVQKVSSELPSLPHFNCLIVSPADLWGRNYESFKLDQDVLRTIKSLKAKYEEDTSISNILFGLPTKDVGIPASSGHMKVLSYAITIALKHYSEEFVSNLEEILLSKFPLHQPVDPPRDQIVHVYFPSRISLWEFLILIFYSVLFSSIYFSVFKIQGLYSKFGLVISIMSCLIASLCIATSLSAHFGLRPLHSRGKYFYPILAALVGFENSIALLRSVISTPEHLDVKIRVAQGLAKEGWSITKYFLSMITVVTFSFFLFIPLVQEICIYGCLVLMCDFYLQLLFMTAVIAVDLKRGDNKEQLGSSDYVNPLFRFPPSTSEASIRLVTQEQREKNGDSVPNLHRRRPLARRGEDRLAPPQSKPRPVTPIPKRLRFTYFVARKRMFQKMLMAIFIGWIIWVIYTSEFVSRLTDPDATHVRNKDLSSVIFSLTNRSSVNKSFTSTNLLPTSSYQSKGTIVSTKDLSDKDTKHLNDQSLRLLKHKRRCFARRLPVSHWPLLFSYYNISLRGHYLSILPPILISFPVSPDEAKAASNSLDPNNQEWIPQLFEGDTVEHSYLNWQEDSAFVPSSRGELFVTAVMIIPALFVLIYAIFALYKCICSRNYAEWRSSRWNSEGTSDETSQIIGEAVPIILSGHQHDVECLATDGSLIASSCLAGVICVWDPTNGERLTHLDRFKLSTALASSSGGRSFPASPECNCKSFREFDVNGCKIRACRSMSAAHDESECCEESLQPSCSLPSFGALPDLTPSIDLSFKTGPVDPASPSSRFDHVQKYVAVEYCHRENERDRFKHNPSCRLTPHSARLTNGKNRCRHSRNLSTGSLFLNDHSSMLSSSSTTSSSFPPFNFSETNFPSEYQYSPVWCLEFADNLLFVGTGSGSLEVWDVFASVLKVYIEDDDRDGITFLKLSGNRVIAARLSGAIEILSVRRSEISNCGDIESQKFDLGGWTVEPDEEVKVTRQNLVKAHQQPITVLTCDRNRVVTGSHDHTLKVLSLLDGASLFTLHGHYGPITSLALGGPLGGEEQSSVGIAMEFGCVGPVIASGAQDGSLCVWDFQTGACVYSVQAHDGAISSITCTSSYILSLGSDEKLCVWERIQGHLLNTLIMTRMYCNSMVMLTNKLLITSQQGSLTVWDITAGSAVRVVRLGDRDRTMFVRFLLPVAGSVVCDYGSQLRVVRLLVADKRD